MLKVFHIAARDFKATVFTKAFLIGALVPPLIMLVAIPLVTMLVKNEPPPVKGRVRVIDLSGDASVVQRVGTALSPEALRERVQADLREGTDKAKEQIDAMVPAGQAQQAKAMMDAQAGAAARGVPELMVITDLPADPAAELEKEKDLLRPRSNASDAGAEPSADAPLALVVVLKHAVKPGPDGTLQAFDLFVRPKVDIRVQGLLRQQVRRAIVDARLAAAGHDPARMASLLRLDAPAAVEMTDSGEKKSSELRQILVPLAFMILLWVSTFSGGQMLLTSTIEEKSNRIMEVLLSAVSPVQLMTGKILGQMAASLAILGLYSVLGLSAITALNRADLIETRYLIYLFVFFFIAYFTIASMMAAIGSAVNDIHEANSLLTPVMLVVTAPMVLMMPIIFNPKGMLATVLSFTPPVSPFVMLLRVCSSDPPPTWQVLLSMLVGVLTVIALVRIAAKVFRVGVLMYGKAPNFATLIRWIRMA